MSTHQQGEDVKIVEIYKLDGKKKSVMQQGLNIVRLSDGSIKKVIK